MRRHRRLLWAALVIVAVGAATLAAAGPDISGTWAASVDGGRGTPTFVFKQDGEKLTGTITNPRGQQKLTGTIKGDKVVFGFEGPGAERGPFKAMYSGKVESPTRMSGTAEFTGSISGTTTWVATRK
ncbi:MAG TPA: hypothetical protein VH436_15530 [Vicinamibacterales bacterium]